METKCTPICPFRAFYCIKKALIIRRGPSGLEAWCAWINDACIGYKCQYSTCNRRALLPDGTCALLSKRKKEKVVPIEEEAEKLEAEYSKLRGKLKRLGVEIERLE